MIAAPAGIGTTCDVGPRDGEDELEPSEAPVGFGAQWPDSRSDQKKERRTPARNEDQEASGARDGASACVPDAQTVGQGARSSSGRP